MATMTLLPMCIQCKKGVDGISPYNLVHDESDNRIKHHVHKKCFFCVKCNCSLTITNAVIPHRTTMLVCPQDFFNIKYPKCQVCSERCIGEKVDKSGLSFHATCYQQLLRPTKSDLTNHESISNAETIEEEDPLLVIDTTSSAEGKATKDKDTAQISMTNSMPLMSMENSLPPMSMENSFPHMPVVNSMPQMSSENSLSQMSTENNLPHLSMDSSLPQMSMENSLLQKSTENSLPQLSSKISLPQMSMENSLPQVSTENSLPQVSTENSLPIMFSENSLPNMSMEISLPPKSIENSFPKISIKNTLPQMSMENALPQMLIENSLPPLSIESNFPNIYLDDKRAQVKLESGSLFFNPNRPDLMLPEQTSIFGMPMQHPLNPNTFVFNQAIVPTAKLHQQQSYQPNIFLNMHPTNMPIVSYPSNGGNFIHNIIQANNNNFINNSMFTYPLNYPTNSFSFQSNIQPATIYNLTADPPETKLNLGAKSQSTEWKMKTQYSTHASNVFNKKNRITISQWQKDILTDMWNWKQFPSGEERRQLGESTGMHPRQVQIWFQNMRRKAKVDSQGINENDDVNVLSNS